MIITIGPRSYIIDRLMTSNSLLYSFSAAMRVVVYLHVVFYSILATDGVVRNLLLL